MKESISADFPFQSNYIEIKGYRMHYVDVGDGDPILFLHGNPTSSYLWRNIIPHLQPFARCIAPDLIGMGKSDKPNIGYTFEEHYDYLEKFIEKLGLKNITLVIHDWGSGLGFHYANMHRNNVKGIAFMEAIVRPMTFKEMPRQVRTLFKMFRTTFIGWLLISVANIFVNKLTTGMIVRKLTKEEFENYKRPYPTVASRKPVRVWPTELPLDGKPKRVYDKVVAYNKWLTETNVPKLFLFAHPGALVTEEWIDYVKTNFPNTKSADIGKGLHFVQEDSPAEIGEAIAEWYKENQF